jgi:Secretion system C-terminal sorting domain
VFVCSGAPPHFCTVKLPLMANKRKSSRAFHFDQTDIAQNLRSMKRLFITTVQILAVACFATGQSLQVYPGDVTNNGVVNNLDFLHLGMAYNFAGPARVNSSQQFLPQPATPWNFQFASGLNMAYADCNGDGVVNYYYDAFPLYTNYGMERDSNIVTDDFVPGLPGVDPPLQFDPAAVPAFVGGGLLVSLPIELGTLNLPAEDVYGLAFSMHVAPQAVDANSIMFNFAETSWANPDNDRIWMYKKVDDSRVDVAWVRTDKNQKRGFGRIGTVDFVIIVDVAPLQQAFPIQLSDIKLMDKFGNYSTVANDTIWLNVPPDSATSGIPLTPLAPKVLVNPNPATDEILIRTTDPIHQITLVDMLGKTVYHQSGKDSDQVAVRLPVLPDGGYMLRIETDSGLLFKQVQIHH